MNMAISHQLSAIGPQSFASQVPDALLPITNHNSGIFKSH
jgi:hypothetical protein